MTNINFLKKSLAYSAVFYLFFNASIAQAMNFLPLDEHQNIGLYLGNQFKLTRQPDDCNDCKTMPQALWYFKNETILVAADATKINQDNSLPPLIWIGSAEMEYGKFSAKEKSFNDYSLTNTTIMHIPPDRITKSPLFLVDKIPTNLSFWNEKTETFFEQKNIFARGQTTNRGFMARTIWPTDFTLDLHAKPKPLAANETLRDLVAFENGGAQSAFESRKLWQRTAHDIPTSYVHPHAGKPVLALILNGAQGDDDEARGGHFAVATGRIGNSGDINNWLVNNYYNLASNSEKGIIAAPTLLDNYFADINSGQSYYRPSYMLVAVLKTDKIPADFQAATNKSFEHFYANDFLYDHSRNNCAGVSLDTLRKLGWDFPTRGKTSQLKAIGAYFYIAITDKSLTNGRAAYDYLTTETTRLLPAVAFDAVGEDLLQWTRQLHIDHTPPAAFTKQLSDDIEAIYFVRIPQIPSSRAFGMAPAYSFDQFMKEAPADRAKWKTVPTTPNPLPTELDNQSAQNSRAKDKPSLVPLPVALVIVLLLAAIVAICKKLMRKKVKK
jgi:hypothetical protein